MFGPVVVPASILYEQLHIEARVPFWFSPIEEGTKTTLGLGAIAPHVVVGISIPLLDRPERFEGVASRGPGGSER